MNTAEAEIESSGASPEVPEQLSSEIATALVGLPYLFARSSYGGELTLHFGRERAHDSPKLSGKVRGTHVLSVRGSGWMLQSGIRRVMVWCGITPVTVSPGAAKPFNVTALESGALIGRGAAVTEAIPLAVESINAIGLSIRLDDGSSFMVVPVPALDDGDDLPEPADWEVLTPTKILRVGPGLNFSIEANKPRP